MIQRKGGLAEGVASLNRYYDMGSKVHVKGLGFDGERDALSIVMGKEGEENFRCLWFCSLGGSSVRKFCSLSEIKYESSVEKEELTRHKV